MRVSELREGGEAMNAPEKLEVPVVVKDTDGNEHEVERLVYRLDRDDKSRYHELFGTPERAARTLAGISYDGDCYSCSLPGAHCYCSGTALLEWLRNDA